VLDILKIARMTLAGLWAVAACGCLLEDQRRAVPSYDTTTRQLIQLGGDLDGDGRLDQWTYLDGNRPLRGEADTDGDGRIDRWEYFDERSQLTCVGLSSQNDGVEDSWSWAAGDERRVDRSRARDRRIDRREFYRGERLIRAEEDGNGDGRIDRWDRYEDGVLREAAFDTSWAGNRPDHRLVYDARGRFLRLEADTDRDGQFVVVPGATEVPR
jgi:hypothetical protein